MLQLGTVKLEMRRMRGDVRMLTVQIQHSGKALIFF
jgi:hypothetical protein